MSTRQASRPCMIPLVQVAPGSILRGAIQQLIPADSRWAQIASAVARSLLEWLMKTIDGMLLRGIRILVDLVADSLHKIARGRGSPVVRNRFQPRLYESYAISEPHPGGVTTGASAIWRSETT